MIYTRRDVGIMAYCGGLLTGLMVAFASCSPPDEPTVQQHPEWQHIAEMAR